MRGVTKTVRKRGDDPCSVAKDCRAFWLWWKVQQWSFIVPADHPLEIHLLR
jgi:hypothetical protein